MLYCRALKTLIISTENATLISNPTSQAAALENLVFVGGLPNLERFGSVFTTGTKVRYIATSEDDDGTVKPLELPVATDISSAFKGWSLYNQPVNCHALSSGVDAFLNAGMDATNIAYVLDSLPTHTDGESHVITFTGCPGAVITDTTETFTVTDEDGTEYSLDNCPTFDTDDADQTLRKAFVLATVKKGWEVQVGTSE